MLEPKLLAFTMGTPDLIRLIIKSRKEELEKSHPGLPKHFRDIQVKINEHANQLKQKIHTQTEVISEVSRNVLQELQLKEYTVISKKIERESSQNTSLRRGCPRRNQTKRSQNKPFLRERPDVPYHFLNFQKQMNGLRVNYELEEANGKSSLRIKG